MWACCQMSSIKEIPYLTVEYVIKSLKELNLGVFPEPLEIVSIPAFCYATLQDSTNDLSETFCSLIEECSFIPFRASAILYQIEKDKYKIQDTSLKRFFVCNSNCDMISFAKIYIAVIQKLSEEHFTASVAFSKIVLEDCMRIWKRGDYYRNVVKDIFPTFESQQRESAINQYAIFITHFIKQIFNNEIPSELSNEYSELVSCIGKTHST